MNYFVSLRTNHYTFLRISSILFIFYSARNLTRNLPYHPLWRFVKITITWREWRSARWEKWLVRRFTKCHPYTSRFSCFANIFLRSRQFDDKCIAGLRCDNAADNLRFSLTLGALVYSNETGLLSLKCVLHMFLKLILEWNSVFYSFNDWIRTDH